MVRAEEAGPEAGAPVLSENPDELSLIFAEEDLFISATQTSRTLEQAPAIATVITAKQLRDMGARNILDALDTVPGFGVSFANEFAVVSTLEVRGIKTSESEKVLVMIDGHPVNNPINGIWSFAFDEFPVDQVKRIEVIRGPGSALYGANAFVAVINIIMMKPGEFEGASVTVGGGSNQTSRQNFLLGHGDGDFAAVGNFDHFDANDTDQFVERDAAGNSGRTNFWRNATTAYAHTQFKKFSLRGLYLEKERGTTLGLTNRIDTRTDFEVRHLFGELAYKDRIGKVDIEMNFGIDQVWFEPRWEFGGIPIPGAPAAVNPVDIASPFSKSRTLSPRIRLSYSPITAHFLTVGAEYHHMRQFDLEHFLNGQNVSDVFNHNQEATREIYAAYLQDEWEMGKGMILTGGVRVDHYTDFGATVNPRLAFVWSAKKALDFKLLFGRAFRAPTFLELYEINNPAALGFSGLKPEIIYTVEGGVTWRVTPGYRLGADVFYNNFTDRIVRQATQNENKGGAEVWGIETEFRADLRAALYGYVNYAFQDSRDDMTKRELPDVPHHRLKAGINWGFFDDRLNTNVGLRWTGERPRGAGDTRAPTDSNTVVDIAVRVERVLKGFELTLKVHNLFDEDVFDPSPLPSIPGDVSVVEGFPRPGSTWLVEGKYVF